MVARIFAAAGFIAAGCAAAAAEDLSGRYEVNGTLANGKTYSNWAVIKMTSENTCDISWSDGSKGVSMLNGTTLSVGSVTGKGEPQVGVYQVAPDGSIEGVFFDNEKATGKGIGPEKLTPVR